MGDFDSNEDLERELHDSMNRLDAEEEEVASSDEEEESYEEEESHEDESDEDEDDSSDDQEEDWREYRKKRKKESRLVKKNEEFMERMTQQMADSQRQMQEFMMAMARNTGQPPRGEDQGYEPYGYSQDTRADEDLSDEELEYRKYRQMQERLEKERYQKQLQQRNANWKDEVVKEASDYWDVVTEENVANLRKRRPRLAARLQKESAKKDVDQVEIGMEIYEAIAADLERQESKSGSGGKVGDMFHGKKSKAPPSAVGQKPKSRSAKRSANDPDELAAEVLRYMG